MSATATRPPQQDLDAALEEPTLVWFHYCGLSLALPNDAPGWQVERAFAALEWLHKPPNAD